MSQQRLAGVLVILGILSAMVWRIGVAPAVLGSFDSSDMPHHDRAFLAIGNILVAAAFTGAIALLSGLCTAPAAQRSAHLARLCSLGAAACATLGAIGLIWWQDAVNVVILFSVLMAVAWALIGYALYQQFRGGIGWLALVTGVVYALAAAAIVAGAHVIFVMTIAVLPLAVALLVSSPAASTMPQQSLAR